MLRTRLWMGALLVALTVGALVVDQRLDTQWNLAWYPFLFLLVLVFAGKSCHELLGLLEPTRRPPTWFCYSAITILLIANWIAPLTGEIKTGKGLDSNPWHWIVGVFAVVVLGAFLMEMILYRGPGQSVERTALAVWMTAYLGLLPCFLVQLRWLANPNPNFGTMALALAIFVPKCADTGAYFTGRLLGRHRITPLLSPKKTWEGALGGLVASIGATIGINRLGPVEVLRQGIWAEIGFGISLGIAAQLGDLAESLLKRARQEKDASQAVPGFGGVLDIVDSIVFAAPVAYYWLRWVG